MHCSKDGQKDLSKTDPHFPCTVLIPYKHSIIFTQPSIYSELTRTSKGHILRSIPFQIINVRVYITDTDREALWAQFPSHLPLQDDESY